jgi:ABC-2 type transport system ATP-binding protein
LLDRPSGRLSAGQKTRAALAKASIDAPEVLLLDEPTTLLDPDDGRGLWLERRAFRRGGDWLLRNAVRFTQRRQPAAERRVTAL